jgi:hypothetical protein
MMVGGLLADQASRRTAVTVPALGLPCCSAAARSWLALGGDEGVVLALA